jgi:hypothetical protein
VVADLYAQVEKGRGGTATRTNQLTEAAKTARATLLELLPALLGPLSRIAKKLADTTLLASVTLTSKQLRKLRPQGFLGVAKAVLDSAARADVAPELAKGGLTGPALKPLRDALTTFAKAQPAPRKTINERVLAGAALEDLLAELMEEVRELDEDMKAFKLLNPELYKGYRQARKIVDSGGGKGKKPDTPA